MHVCALPFRAGWTPKNVRAVLSNIMKTRPDGKGGTAPCETWDNATLLCEAVDPHSGEPFPMTLRTERICPGESNTWYIEVLGTQASARYTTRYPTTLEVLEFDGKNQDWKTLDLGYKSAYPAITGGIFEFGFSDAILQMWGAFLMELTHGSLPSRFMGPATPQEAHISHRLFTAALKSQAEGSAVAL
jgi:predicted dehydrogenase